MNQFEATACDFKGRRSRSAAQETSRKRRQRTRRRTGAVAVQVELTADDIENLRRAVLLLDAELKDPVALALCLRAAAEQAVRNERDLLAAVKRIRELQSAVDSLQGRIRLLSFR